MKQKMRRFRPFKMLEIVYELHDLAIKEPTEENIAFYRKINDLFFEYLKSFDNSK